LGALYKLSSCFGVDTSDMKVIDFVAVLMYRCAVEAICSASVLWVMNVGKEYLILRNDYFSLHVQIYFP
jgi:predicted choloylglycine hydrolase